MNRHDLKAGAILGCFAAVLTGLLELERRVLGADQAPTATSSYDLTLTGSTRDSAGRTITVTAPVHVEISEAPPPPPPVPVGITFGAVTETLGAVTTAKPSGWMLILHGTGFPTTGTLRLQVAGRIAPASSLVWKPTAVQFTVPPGPASATAPITGAFEIFELVNNSWLLKGRGGSFTILPSSVLPAAKRKSGKERQL